MYVRKLLAVGKRKIMAELIRMMTTMWHILLIKGWLSKLGRIILPT